ncbi:hypothetical protein V8E53_001687 [Lactarius tabidus]
MKRALSAPRRSRCVCRSSLRMAALMERLIRFTQAHDSLKKNAECTQKLAQDSNAALDTYQVRMLEEQAEQLARSDVFLTSLPRMSLGVEPIIYLSGTASNFWSIYVALHQDTDFALTQFSVVRDQEGFLPEPPSYPACNVTGHIRNYTDILHDNVALDLASSVAIRPPSAQAPL